MSVECHDCGAELIGAVNRCWNCGRDISPKDLFASSTPAISSAMPPTGLPSNASSESTGELPTPDSASQDPTSTDSALQNSTIGAADDSAVDAILMEPELEPELAAASPFLPVAATRAIRIPTYRNPYLGMVCAWAAACLGGSAWGMSVWFPLGAAILAVMGMTISSIAVRSKPWLGTIGMLLCVLALVTGGAAFGLRKYVDQYGRYPWQEDPATGPSSIPLSDENFDEWE